MSLIRISIVHYYFKLNELIYIYFLMAHHYFPDQFQIFLTYFQYTFYFGEHGCSIIYYIETFAYVASIFHLVAVGFERYMF